MLQQSLGLTRSERGDGEEGTQGAFDVVMRSRLVRKERVVECVRSGKSADVEKVAVSKDQESTRENTSDTRP